MEAYVDWPEPSYLLKNCFRGRPVDGLTASSFPGRKVPLSNGHFSSRVPRWRLVLYSSASIPILGLGREGQCAHLPFDTTRPPCTPTSFFQRPRRRRKACVDLVWHINSALTRSTVNTSASSLLPPLIRQVQYRPLRRMYVLPTWPILCTSARYN